MAATLILALPPQTCAWVCVCVLPVLHHDHGHPVWGINMFLYQVHEEHERLHQEVLEEKKKERQSVTTSACIAAGDPSSSVCVWTYHQISGPAEGFYVGVIVAVVHLAEDGCHAGYHPGLTEVKEWERCEAERKGGTQREWHTISFWRLLAAIHLQPRTFKSLLEICSCAIYNCRDFPKQNKTKLWPFANFRHTLSYSLHHHRHCTHCGSRGQRSERRKPLRCYCCTLCINELLLKCYSHICIIIINSQNHCQGDWQRLHFLNCLPLFTLRLPAARQGLRNISIVNYR